MMGVCNNKEAQQLQMITEEYIYTCTSEDLCLGI